MASKSEAPGARSVLLLGFGGADVEDLEPQAAWYSPMGRRTPDPNPRNLVRWCS